MTDEELIARLRSNIFGTGTTMLASDRIEQLVAEVSRIEELEAKLAKAERALSLTRRADDLREVYHRLPNDKNRIGDKRSRKSHARDAWLKAFRKAAREARATLAELTGGKDE